MAFIAFMTFVAFFIFLPFMVFLATVGLTHFHKLLRHKQLRIGLAHFRKRPCYIGELLCIEIKHTPLDYPCQC